VRSSVGGANEEISLVRKTTPAADVRMARRSWRADCFCRSLSFVGWQAAAHLRIVRGSVIPGGIGLMNRRSDRRSIEVLPDIAPFSG
jgi:hypothetical protein